MSRATTWGLVLGLWTTGCGARALPPAATPPPEGPVAAARPDPSFAQGLSEMARHERAGDWSEASCKETLALLLGGTPSAAASYDAGLVQRRCKHEGEAKALFEAAVARDPRFYPARAALALGSAGDPAGLDRAIAELSTILRETRFSNADTLVSLATLQMRRANATADEEGTGDLDRAGKNLHRALAIDDSNMSALNQLALVHLQQARHVGAAGAPRQEGKKAATQALELAALVSAQAIAKNPRWAPIHNTAGLIEVELGNLSRAAAFFDEARRLDPRLLEAQMNVAALNLQVRGFARAEEAYRAVLAIRPEDYDARVGLALAIRGQIDEPSEVTRVAAATQELEHAKQIAPERPEAYFNQAILVQEYGGRTGKPGEALVSLARAKGLYEQFIAKADGAPAFTEARERARDRLKDIQQMVEVEKLPATN
jgi:tetratricopeptide (TPR) repeat protein